MEVEGSMTHYCCLFRKCSKCGHLYTSFRQDRNCPVCGSPPSSTPNIIKGSLFAWYYHRRLYGKGTLPVYAPQNAYDQTIYISCAFLDQYVETRPSDDEEFIRKYLERLDLSGSEDGREVLHEYFRVLLKCFRSSWAAPPDLFYPPWLLSLELENRD